jgi:hypothetical protein
MTRLLSACKALMASLWAVSKENGAPQRGAPDFTFPICKKQGVRFCYLQLLNFAEAIRVLQSKVAVTV